MKVLIIAALVLVAQCQLQTPQQGRDVPGDRGGQLHPALQGSDPQIAGEETKKPEDAKKVIEGDMPFYPEEMESMNLRFYDYYKTALQQKGGRRDEALKATLIMVIKNEVFEQLIPKDKEDPLKDPKNLNLVVELIRSQTVKDEINMEDPKLATREGIKIKNLLDNELTLIKDGRTGTFTVNDIRANLRPMEGKEMPTVLITDDFVMPEMKQKITEVLGGKGPEAGVDATRGVEGQPDHRVDAGQRREERT